MPNHVSNVVSFIGPESLEKEVEELFQKFHYDSDEAMQDVGIYSLDFNKIIPMPESLEIQSGSYTEQGYSVVKKYFESLLPEEQKEELSFIEQNLKKYIDHLKSITNEYNVLDANAKQTEEFIQEFAPKRHESILNDVSPKVCYILGLVAFYNKQKYGFTDWYDWHIAKWGTKWNCYSLATGWTSEMSEQFVEKDEMVLKTIYFETAWSTPFEVLETLSEMYPDLKVLLEYADEDLGSNCGVVLYQNGDALDGYIPETYKEGIETALAIKGYTLEDYGLKLNRAETNYVDVENTSFKAFNYKGTDALFVDSYYTEEDTPKDVIPYYVIAEDQEKFVVAPLGKETKEKVLYTIFTDYKGLPEKDIFEIAKKDFVDSNFFATFNFLDID